MVDEQKIEKKYPKVVANAFIFNSSGEIFVMRSPKWGDRLVVPGGHIEYGESIMDTVRREVKEETNLEIDEIKFLTPTELIEPTEFTDSTGKGGHIICLDFRAKLKNEDQEVKLDGYEGIEYFWLKPEVLVKRGDVEKTTKEVVEKFFLKEKHGLFSKKCKECEKNKKQLDEYKSGWQRALADYKNLQSETEKRRSEWAQMSEAQILEEFIPVYENFKKAFATDGKNNDSWAQGIEYIKKQFADILKNHGVEEIKTLGEKFNPNWHEAVGEEEAEGKEEGEIVKEVDGGYMMGDKVLKVAKVIVVK